MPQEKPRRWPATLAVLGALLLAGCTQARRGAPAEGGADGFPDAAWGAGQDWTPSWPLAWSRAQEGADPARDGAGDDDDPRLLPGELAAIARDFGRTRRPGAPFGADDLHGPYLLLWPGMAAAGGQEGGAAPAEPDGKEGPPVETIPADATAPILAPVTGPATIPEPATMALLGAALIGLGLLRRWD